MGEAELQLPVLFGAAGMYGDFCLVVFLPNLLEC